MGLSRVQQEAVASAVVSAKADELAEYRANAEAALHHLNSASRQKLLTREELLTAHIAVEYLTRIEAQEQDGGWWFRSKRRVQLMQMYFGS